MIIFESILTTFELNIVLKAAGEIVQIGLSLKSNHHEQILIAQICKTRRRMSTRFSCLKLAIGISKINIPY